MKENKIFTQGREKLQGTDSEQVLTVFPALCQVFQSSPVLQQ